MIGDPNSSLYKAYGKSSNSKEVAENRAMREALSDTSEGGTQQKILNLELQIKEMKAELTKLQNLRGQFPISVVGNVISVDPGAKPFDPGSLTTITENTCINGAAGTRQVLASPSVPL